MATATPTARVRTTWRFIGLAAIAGIVVLSLLPMPDLGMAVAQGDKIGHVLAYFAVTAWHAPLAATRGRLVIHAIAFFALGLVMEALQSLVPWRAGNDLGDALANLTGVVIATTIALASWPVVRDALAAIARRVAR